MGTIGHTEDIQPSYDPTDNGSVLRRAELGRSGISDEGRD